MKRYPPIILSMFVLVITTALSGTAFAGRSIAITTPVAPPAWGVMERLLLEEKSQHIVDFYDFYFNERGYLLHKPHWGSVDGVDDLFDIFGDWTILYSLGGRQSVLDLYRKGNNGGIRQYTEYKTVATDIAKDGAYYKEFVCMADWRHTGEGLRGFHLEALTDPEDVTYQKRARRFAGFYMNEDPDAPNYDPEHKLIRSMMNGSRGPLMRRARPVDWAGDMIPGKYHMLHGRYGSRQMEEMTPEKYENEYLVQVYELAEVVGDNPLNLLTTNLALNAYALAHEEKYKDWLVEYVDAWAERIDKNGGNIPSTIGLDGTIGGGTAEGSWYGGSYGSWDAVFWYPASGVQYRSLFSMGMWAGFANALLVTGDQKYIDVLRWQMDNIFAAKKVEDGIVYLPRNYGVRGEKSEAPDYWWEDGDIYWKEKKVTEPKWYNYQRNGYMNELIDLYLYSMEPKDLERIHKNGWVEFLEGRNPGYPVQSLQQGFEEVRGDNERMRNDETTPETRLVDWPMRQNHYGAVTNLNRLMCGANLSGMQYRQLARLRYFDPERVRSGIPEDVAALVTGMNKEKTNVTLVNLSQTEGRTVIVQTGSYGEHQCSRVEVNGESYAIDDRFFTVHLAPGAGAELVVYADRFVNKPTLALPWHGDIVPKP
ncbi:MAG: hypothetical protein O7C75_08755 [Verrucomicrobia bacterium]|nr:hypothetical protein [Verrucomicrobiota bacterium]